MLFKPTPDQKVDVKALKVNLCNTESKVNKIKESLISLMETRAHCHSTLVMDLLREQLIHKSEIELSIRDLFRKIYKQNKLSVVLQWISFKLLNQSVQYLTWLPKKRK